VKDRSAFCSAIAALDLSHPDRAIALLWYYAQTQTFEERTASELATDLREQGFPRPNTTRLHNDLKRSRYTVRGRRAKTFQLDVRRVADLDSRYASFLGVVEVKVEGQILPLDLFKGTRRLYLEKMAHQINACYEYGLYDACAVLCRRLMESLIIEVYIKNGLQHEIRTGPAFFMLDALIAHIRSHTTLVVGRNSPNTMDDIKQLGDTAAHDRTYITQARDIDEVKAAYRRLIQDLATGAGVL
jgi:hypothetical protein